MTPNSYHPSQEDLFVLRHRCVQSLADLYPNLSLLLKPLPPDKVRVETDVARLKRLWSWTDTLKHASIYDRKYSRAWARYLRKVTRQTNKAARINR